MPINLMKHIKFIIFAVVGVAFFLAANTSHAQWNVDSKISISDTNAALSENADLCLVVNGDSVHVVWWDTKTDSTAIFYRHSYDGGATWAAPMRITPFFKSVDFSSIAVSGSMVHVAWRNNSDSGSYYIHSTDGGNTWGNSISLGVYYFWPSVASSGSNVYMTFNSSIPGNSEVYFRLSTDNGTTWNPVYQISNALGRSEDQSISVFGNDVHLVWNDNRTGIMQAWYRHSRDNGVTWGPETQLSNAVHFSYFPVVNATGQYVDVARGDRDANNNFHIMYMHSNDSGATWSAETELSNNATSSAYPVVKRDGQNVHIVWFDFNGDIYYRRSLDGGVTWDPVQDLVSNKPAKPFIAISGPVLHLIWLDSREGHPEVYYKRNPTGNPVPPSMHLTVTPSGVDFGNYRIGSSKDSAIMLHNSGSTQINILFSALADPANGFGFFNVPKSIAPNDSATITVRFSPQIAEPYDATLKLTTDESPSSTYPIYLRGNGEGSSKFSLPGYEIDFGNVDSGKSARKPLTIMNIGTTTTIDSITIEGSNEFAVDSPKVPFQFPSGGNNQLWISFNPNRLGSISATLRISTADGVNASVSLYGVGIADSTQQSVHVINSVLNLLEVTPNPTSNNAMLHLSTTKNLEDVKISFYNSAGQLLSSQNIGELSEGLQNIPLALPQISGVAFLRITSGGELIGTAEIVIVH